jgi:hypothetical protein
MELWGWLVVGMLNHINQQLVGLTSYMLEKRQNFYQHLVGSAVGCWFDALSTSWYLVRFQLEALQLLLVAGCWWLEALPPYP